MKRLAVGAVAALLLGTGWLSGQGGGPKDIEVIAVHIVKPLPKDSGLERIRFPGTKLEMSVTQPGKYILEIDTEATTLTSITDDKNTDLTKGYDKFPFLGWLNFPGERSKDGSRFLFLAEFPRAPADGATKVRLKGALVLRMGADEKTVEEKKVTVKEGKPAKVGPFEVGQGKAFFSETAVVDFVSTTPGLKVVAFSDKDGKPLTGKQVGHLSFTLNGKTTYTAQYEVKADLTELTVRVTYFAKVESVTVPLDVTVSAGF
jgi:hypothetical protein